MKREKEISYEEMWNRPGLIHRIGDYLRSCDPGKNSEAGKQGNVIIGFFWVILEWVL